MSIWIALAVGIILGWLIEWVIDWLYWRRGIAGFYATENELRGELQTVQQEQAETTEKMTALRGQLDEATNSKLVVDQQLQEATAAKASADQQLQEMAAAKASVDQQLQEAITANGSVGQQVLAITAAKVAVDKQLEEMAATKASIEQQLQETTAARASVEQQLQETTAARASVEQQLQEATTAQATTEQKLEETLAEKATVDQQLQEALAALEEARQPRRDDLEQIDGIGPVYEQRLFKAGINTFAQLAITPLDRLRDIIQPASWQHTNFDSWGEQARRCAEVVIFDLLPYRLEEIRGIGPTYAKRLNAQGIMTFSDLAHTSEERLREIIPQRGGLPNNFADWIREAHAFVGLTTGDRPPLPIERIKGIGPVFATRLDLAGIHTFADLAAANEEQLREIIGTRFLQIANFSRWIEQAKTYAGGEAQVQAQIKAVEMADATMKAEAQENRNQDDSSQSQAEITPADNGSLGA